MPILAGSAWSMQRSIAKMLWSKDTLWHLRMLWQPECGGIVEHRSCNMWGAGQGGCHHPKITREILCFWQLGPVKCCRTFSRWHKKATLIETEFSGPCTLPLMPTAWSKPYFHFTNQNLLNLHLPSLFFSTVNNVKSPDKSHTLFLLYYDTSNFWTAWWCGNSRYH